MKSYEEDFENLAKEEKQALKEAERLEDVKKQVIFIYESLLVMKVF